jgi:hypothetical protein
MNTTEDIYAGVISHARCVLARAGELPGSDILDAAKADLEQALADYVTIRGADDVLSWSAWTAATAGAREGVMTAATLLARAVGEEQGPSAEAYVRGDESEAA